MFTRQPLYFDSNSNLRLEKVLLDYQLKEEDSITEAETAVREKHLKMQFDLDNADPFLDEVI